MLVEGNAWLVHQSRSPYQKPLYFCSSCIFGGLVGRRNVWSCRRKKNAGGCNEAKAETTCSRETQCQKESRPKLERLYHKQGTNSISICSKAGCKCQSSINLKLEDVLVQVDQLFVIKDCRYQRTESATLDELVLSVRVNSRWSKDY